MQSPNKKKTPTALWFEHLMPPGAPLRPFFEVFFWGLGISVFCSMWFLAKYFDRREELYYTDRFGDIYLRGDAVMPDFVNILSGTMIWFFVLALLMAAFIVYNYGGYYRGRKSIYTMRRLPNRWEMHKRSIVLPVMAALLTLVVAFAVLLIYYAIYMNCTPEQCLRPDQWAKLWREIL